MHPYVYSSVIYNSQELEAAQVSISRSVGKNKPASKQTKKLVHLYNEILCGYKKKEILPFASAWIGGGRQTQPTLDYNVVLVWEKSGYGLSGLAASRSGWSTIQVLSGSVLTSEAQLGKHSKPIHVSRIYLFVVVQLRSWFVYLCVFDCC